jgi:hypothetical protein
MGKTEKTAVGLIAVLLSLASWAQAPQLKEQQRTAQTAHVGRYQIVLYQGQMPRFNTYLLDTETGKTWMMKSLPDGTDFWEPVYRADTDAEELALARKHPSSTPAKAETSK